MIFLHYVTHAVSLAVIATLLHQYLQLSEENKILLDQGRQLDHISLNQPQSPKEQLNGNAAFEMKTGSVSENSCDVNTARSENVERLHGTSVWCFEAKTSDTICQFTELCYSQDIGEFIFFHSNSSIFENFDQSDMNRVDMSSVAGHNAHYLKLSYLPANTVHQFSLNWINLTSLIFFRFKPDNIMHVFHDDIIPMHHTLRLISLLDKSREQFKKFHIQLVFLDDSEDIYYKFLYELFTDVVPLYNSFVQSQHGLICFRNAFLGITKKTIWYDYGFHHPQRPLHPLQVSGYHIRETFSYITNKLNIKLSEKSKEKPYLVLVSRSTTRCILNELELSLSIAGETGLQIVTVNLEVQELTEVLNLIARSVGIVGMHGSLLILTLALKPGSILIELYPYAVNPEDYTPYKTLASLPGMGIIYRALANQHVRNTVGHPDWPASIGGISHLSLERQLEIMNQIEVPEHLCCADPSWLYHIYQDTKVDVPAVTDLVVQALEEANTFGIERQTGVAFIPSKVIDIQCQRTQSSMILSWKPPWNLPYLTFEKVSYEVIRKYVKEDDHILYIVKELNYKMTKLQKNEPFHVWIRCVLDEQHHGPFVYVDQC